MENEKQAKAAASGAVVKMSEIVSVIANYYENPFNGAYDAYLALLSRLSVVPYRRLAEKAAAVTQILDHVPADSLLDYIIDLPCAEFVYGLLPYISNIDDDVSGRVFVDKDGKPLLGDGKAMVSLVDPEFYDMADRTGFIDYLKNGYAPTAPTAALSLGCAADYGELCHLVDQALDFRDVKRVADFASSVSGDRMEELTKAIRDFRGTLTPEMMKSMAAIASLVDPAWAATKSAVADQAMEAALQEDAVESRPDSEAADGKKAVGLYEAEKAEERSKPK
ncbi:MAG: hypothetical protein ABFC95_02425 [Smithella sp.]